MGLYWPHKRTLTNASSIAVRGDIVTRYITSLSKALQMEIAYLDPVLNEFRQTFQERLGKLMDKATKLKLYILQSYSNSASHWNDDIELESVIAVWGISLRT